MRRGGAVGVDGRQHGVELARLAALQDMVDDAGLLKQNGTELLFLLVVGVEGVVRLLEVAAHLAEVVAALLGQGACGGA